MQKLFLALLLLTACGKAQDSSIPGGAAAPAGVPLASASLREPTPPAGNGPAPQLTAAEQGLAVANEVRRQNGLAELATDPLLNAVAQLQAEDMLRRHYFDHNTPEGVTPFQRMEHGGVRFNAAAENIAMGVSDPRKVFDMWLNSPGHRHNLLNKVYGRHGIGYAGGYWVHDFCN